MELSERKQKILCMAVEEYIRDCSPITSGSVKDITSLNCSTATLRNELNALEAMGYLKQLHTSGGRIPTAQGYRYYVERLLGEGNAGEGELDKVKEVIPQTEIAKDVAVGKAIDFIKANAVITDAVDEKKEAKKAAAKKTEE